MVINPHVPQYHHDECPWVSSRTQLPMIANAYMHSHLYLLMYLYTIIHNQLYAYLFILIGTHTHMCICTLEIYMFICTYPCVVYMVRLDYGTHGQLADSRPAPDLDHWSLAIPKRGFWFTCPIHGPLRG